MDPVVLTIYCPVLNLPFLGKVVKRAVVVLFQAFLDDSFVLDPFQSSFYSDHGVETMLVAFTDDSGGSWIGAGCTAVAFRSDSNI